MRFEPSGFTRNQEIPIAKSLADYIFRWLASRFLTFEEQEAVGIIKRDGGPAPTEASVIPVPAPAPASNARPQPISASVKQLEDTQLLAMNPMSNSNTRLTFVVDRDAPACADCGAITVRSGACYKCMNCGATTGCS